MSEESSLAQQGRPQRSGEDRRQFVRQRVPVTDPLQIKVSHTFPLRAEIFDIGAGGVFILTTDPLPVGSKVQYSFNLPDGHGPVEGQAKVVREEETLGMAIEFEDLSPDDLERLKNFVASLLFKVPFKP